MNHSGSQPSLDGIQPRGLAPNEVEDHEYDNHQHDDANDPDTSKSSDHRSSSSSDAGVPRRGVGQSPCSRRENIVFDALLRGRASRKRRGFMSHMETQQGDGGAGTFHICGQKLPTQASRHLMGAHQTADFQTYRTAVDRLHRLLHHKARSQQLMDEAWTNSGQRHGEARSGLSARGAVWNSGRSRRM